MRPRGKPPEESRNRSGLHTPAIRAAFRLVFHNCVFFESGFFFFLTAGACSRWWCRAFSSGQTVIIMRFLCGLNCVLCLSIYLEAHREGEPAGHRAAFLACGGEAGQRFDDADGLGVAARA